MNTIIKSKTQVVSFGNWSRTFSLLGILLLIGVYLYISFSIFIPEFQTGTLFNIENVIIGIAFLFLLFISLKETISIFTFKITFDFKNSKIIFNKILGSVEIKEKDIVSWGIRKVKTWNFPAPSYIYSYFECRFKNGKTFFYPVNPDWLLGDWGTKNYTSTSLFSEILSLKSADDKIIEEDWIYRTKYTFWWLFL